MRKHPTLLASAAAVCALAATTAFAQHTNTTVPANDPLGLTAQRGDNLDFGRPLEGRATYRRGAYVYRLAHDAVPLETSLRSKLRLGYDSPYIDWHRPRYVDPFGREYLVNGNRLRRADVTGFELAHAGHTTALGCAPVSRAAAYDALPAAVFNPPMGTATVIQADAATAYDLQPAPPVRTLTDAWAALDNDRPHAALRAFVQATIDDPTNAEAWQGYAAAAEATGQTGRATWARERAAAIGVDTIGSE